MSTVALFDQGLTQVLQLAATGLEPGGRYVLALAPSRNGAGQVEPLVPVAGDALRAPVQTQREESRKSP